MTIYSAGQSGDWSNNLTWTPHGVPGAGDTASIGNSITVAVSKEQAASFTSVVNGGGLVLRAGAKLNTNLSNAGNLSVDANADTYLGQYLGAAGGVVTVGSKSVLTVGGIFQGAVNSVNLSDGATLKLNQTGGSLDVVGNFALTASVLQLTKLVFGRSTNLAGSITMSDSINNIVSASVAGVELVNGGTISGAGALGAGTMSLVNGKARGPSGLIRATGDDNALVIDLVANGSLKNNGLIEGVGDAGLLIETSNFAAGEAKVENNGGIRAVNASKVELSHVDVLNKGDSPDSRALIEVTDIANLVFDTVDLKSTNADILATDRGTIRLNNAQLAGGNLRLDGALTALIAKGQNVFRNVAFGSTGLVAVEAGALLNVGGAGSFTLAAAMVAGQLSFGQDVTLKGGKDVSITGELKVSYPTLTNVDEKVFGSGIIKTASLVNQAAGSIAGRLTLDVNTAPDSVGVLTNAGSISGATIKAKRVDNTGTISGVVFDVPYGIQGRLIDNGKAGVINGSIFGRTEIVNAGLVAANGAGEVTSFAGTILHGGTVSSSNGGMIVAKASTDATLLDPAKIAQGSTIVVDNGATLDLDGPAVLDQVNISIAGSTLTTTLHLLSPNVTLQGGSTITLSNSASNRLLFTKLTNAVGTISGAGEITEAAPDIDSALINQAGGLIQAKGSEDLTISIDRLVNEGVLKADDSTLTIHVDGTIQGGGQAFVTNGGKIDMSEARQFLGNFRYAGPGTILGPDLVPAGTISGFATGDAYVFGKTNALPDKFSTLWTENAAGTGGTLTILAGAGQTYANLILAGSYASDDFAVTQFALPDGNHVAVSFAGALKWAEAVDGNWQDAAKWAPTGLYAPGAADNALITVVDQDDPSKTYTVAVTQDTTVRTVATGSTANLEIKSGRFTTLQGTDKVANAGYVRVMPGASFTTGGTFAQASTGWIVVKGSHTAVNIAKDGGISGGLITVKEGATLFASGGTARLTGVEIGNSSEISIVKTRLDLVNSVISGDGTIFVTQGSFLDLANSKINNNTIWLRGALEADTDIVLKSTVTMDQPGKIISDGIQVTFTNAGNIRGGGRIGDATLALVNKNAIEADSGMELDIATGSNTVVNNGNMFAAAAGKLTLESALKNTVGLIASGGTAIFKAAVDNSGLMRAGGDGSLLDFRDSLTNSGFVSAAGGGGVQFAKAVVQTAAAGIVADATSSRILLGPGASVTGGQIALGYLSSLEASDGGEVGLSSVTVTMGDSSDIKVVDATMTIADSEIDAGKLADVSVSGAKSTLVLAESSMEGGRLNVDHTSLRVGGTVTLTDTQTRLDGARILGVEATASLTNAGLITAEGISQIGDDFFSLDNEGTITTGATSGARLTIDTDGANVFNSGTISASVVDTKVIIASQLINLVGGRLLSGAGILQTDQLQNNGDLEATGAGLIEVMASATNDIGLMQADAGGTIKLHGSVNNASGKILATDGGTIEMIGELANDGTVQAKSGGTIEASVAVNFRTLTATGAGSTLDLSFTNPLGGNRGDIVATDQGTVRVETGVTNGAGASLLAKNGGTIEVSGPVKGGIARISGDDSLMDLEGSATEDTTTQVSFIDNGIGQLMLDHSSRFTGTVAGFASSDTIDVTDIAFVDGASFYDTSKQQLRISDGPHNATIQLIGHYAASAFAFSSDGHGGTLVTGVAPPAPLADLSGLLVAHT